MSGESRKSDSAVGRREGHSAGWAGGCSGGIAQWGSGNAIMALSVPEVMTEGQLTNNNNDNNNKDNKNAGHS